MVYGASWALPGTQQTVIDTCGILGNETKLRSSIRMLLKCFSSLVDKSVGILLTVNPMSTAGFARDHVHR